MIPTRFPLIALGALLPLLPARAELSTGLIAYYNFEATGSDGIANQAGGGATHNGSYGSGTTTGVTPAIAGSGAGFAGDAAYPGADPAAATDRSDLLVGNALNLAKDDLSTTAGSGWFNVPTLNAATLGTNFTISAWFFLAPDADNTGTSADTLRDYVFEGSTNFDVSFGTNDTNGNTYVSWIGETSGAQNAGTLATGAWHHVVHVFAQSGANTTMSVFINGFKVGTTVSTATANMNFTSLNLGAARNGVRVFDGLLDEVAVWSRSLSANEVSVLNQRGVASLSLTADPATVGKVIVNVEPSDDTMGQTFGGGLYAPSEKATLEALPGIGHVFTGWSAPFQSQPELFFLTVAGPVNVTANFARDTADTDGDGLTNYQELVVYQTNPGNPDTDGDLVKDGDEVKTTLTNPLLSQLAAVEYVLANLGGATPGDTELTRNEIANSLTLKVKASESATLGGWSDLTPASPGIAAGNGSGGFLLQVPGNAGLERFFRMEGVQP